MRKERFDKQIHDTLLCDEGLNVNFHAQHFTSFLELCEAFYPAVESVTGALPTARFADAGDALLQLSADVATVAERVGFAVGEIAEELFLVVSLVACTPCIAFFRV